MNSSQTFGPSSFGSIKMPIHAWNSSWTKSTITANTDMTFW